MTANDTKLNSTGTPSNDNATPMADDSQGGVNQPISANPVAEDMDANKSGLGENPSESGEESTATSTGLGAEPKAEDMQPKDTGFGAEPKAEDMQPKDTGFGAEPMATGGDSQVAQPEAENLPQPETTAAPSIEDLKQKMENQPLTGNLAPSEDKPGQDGGDENKPDDEKGQKKVGHSMLSTALLVAGPLFLVATIAMAFLNFSVSPAQVLQQFPVDFSGGGQAVSQEEFWQTWLEYHPDNPSRVTATCGGQNMVSGAATGCSSIRFEWEEPDTNQSQANVTGYQVYFGPVEETGTVLGNNIVLDPVRFGEKQTDNVFVAENFDTSRKNYLYVRALTDSDIYPFGSTMVVGQEPDNTPFALLFEFVPSNPTSETFIPSKSSTVPSSMEGTGAQNYGGL
jgi:hypothetical protein